MTNEERDLLLKDLCARMFSGVMFDYNNNEPLKVEGIVHNIVYFKGYNYQTEGDECYANITKCRPYLRPMSSMTDEEKKTYESFITGIATNEVGAWELTEWLNSRYLDFRGLIPKNLALEAPEDMYKI